MKIVDPLDDRVLIRPTDAESMTKGGIVLPEQAREKPHEGTVVSFGPGKRGADGVRQEVALTKGDVVIYSKYAGTAIKINEVDHVVLRETDVVCVIRDAPVPEPAAALA